jgi:hypothetical protein
LTSGRVFVIGFNKCGTTSFAHLFEKSGMKVAKNKYKSGNILHNFAKRMQKNVEAGKAILTGIDDYDAYMDIELSRFHAHIEGIFYFDTIDAQYPGSKFILNIRDKEKWLHSRANHGDGRYLAKYVASAGLSSRDEALAVWSKAWDDHLARVQNHFAVTPSKLLVFDIEKDDPAKIAAFLPERTIQVRHWGQRNARHGWSEAARSAARS